MLNAVLLKRAMQCLNLSGVALAERVTALREDGRRTAPETISRWLNGTRPVDPFLLGWVAELLRSELLKTDQPRVRLPTSGLIIAVANLKGGVGKTTVARNLAAISKSLGLKSTFLYAEYEESRRYPDYIINPLKALRIGCPDLSLDEILEYTPSADEIAVVDVTCSTAHHSFKPRSSSTVKLKADPNGFLARFRPDLYVVPGDFGSSLDNWATKSFIDSDALQAPVQLLHRPALMSMDFASTARGDGLDVSSAMFCPFFIPQAVTAEVALPPGLLSEWLNEDQQLHHYKLFEHILNLLGGEIMESYQVINEIRVMNLTGLLDFAEAGMARRKTA